MTGRLPALFLACVLSAHAAPWRRVTSPHFELFTDAPKRSATEVLQRLELARHHFRPWSLPPLPVRVLLFSDERQFAPLRTEATTKGFFQAGAERDSIALLDSGDGTLRGVIHEYVHLVLHHSATTLPRWQEEGLAEFHSTLRGSRDIRTGDLIPSHLALLQQEGLLDAARMAAAARGDTTALTGRQIPVFYAQSWALIHALHSAGPNAQRHLMPPFVPIPEATLRSLTEQLPQYLRRPTNGFNTGTRAEPAPRIEEEAIDPARAQLVLADLALRVGSVKYAQALLTNASTQFPNDPDVLHELGILALSQKDEPLARQRFTAAIAHRNARAQSFFELALLERDALGPNAPRVRELLTEAAGRNPHHAEALFLLGQMEESQGRPDKAIEWLQRAVAVLPRQSRMWYALAHARNTEGQVVAARKAAEQALATAANQMEREQAEALLTQLREGLTLPTPAPPKPPVTVPQAWNQPKGPATVEGELRELRCTPTGNPVLGVYTRDTAYSLLLTDQTRTTGAPGQLQCGPQQPPRRVVVTYDPANHHAITLDFPNP